MEVKNNTYQKRNNNIDNYVIPFELQKAAVFFTGTLITLALGLAVVSISGVMVRQLVKANL